MKRNLDAICLRLGTWCVALFVRNERHIPSSISGHLPHSSHQKYVKWHTPSFCSFWVVDICFLVCLLAFSLGWPQAHQSFLGSLSAGIPQLSFQTTVIQTLDLLSNRKSPHPEKTPVSGVMKHFKRTTIAVLSKPWQQALRWPQLNTNKKALQGPRPVAETSPSRSDSKPNLILSHE